MLPVMAERARQEPRDPAQSATSTLLPNSVRPEQLAVSKYEKVSSLLLATCMLVAIFVALMFLLWLTDRPMSPMSTLPPVKSGGDVAGSRQKMRQIEFLSPAHEDVEALLEPSVEHRLRAITEVASTVAIATESFVQPRKAAAGSTSGVSVTRAGNAEDIGIDLVPRFERWKLRFAAKDLKDYAKQLDAHNIELAAVGGDIQGVDYAISLSTTPKRRRGESKDEQRLYFMWTASSPLTAYDRQLLNRAGIKLSERHILKFIPEKLESSLALLELDYAKSAGRGHVSEILETVFESRLSGDGYRFEVISQRHKPPRKGKQ